MGFLDNHRIWKANRVEQRGRERIARGKELQKDFEWEANSVRDIKQGIKLPKDEDHTIAGRMGFAVAKGLLIALYGSIIVPAGKWGVDRGRRLQRYGEKDLVKATRLRG